MIYGIEASVNLENFLTFFYESSIIRNHFIIPIQIFVIII